MFLISRGVGRSDLEPLPPLSEAVSSRMMSLQSSMHSSQMNTEGPAISFLTSCWLLPQKEQYRSFSPPLFSVMRFPRFPSFALSPVQLAADTAASTREVRTRSQIPYSTEP